MEVWDSSRYVMGCVRIPRTLEPSWGKKYLTGQCLDFVGLWVVDGWENRNGRLQPAVPEEFGRNICEEVWWNERGWWLFGL